nr:cupin domain-containing protein [uncultured Cetobacterium sp.]
MNEKELEMLIKKVIEDELKKKSDIKYMDKSGIGVVKTSKINRVRFDTGNPKDEVYVTDLFTLEESPRMGTGIMEMIKSTFDWTLRYDEIIYVLEGRLEIVIDGRIVAGDIGDVILIPKDSTIKFSAPEYAKFTYVAYPANWAEQK